MAAMFLSTVAVIGPLSCAAYDKAVNVARSDDDARKLLSLCMVLSVAVAVVVSPILAALSLTGVMSHSLLALGPLLSLLPVAIALEGTTLAAGSWLLRHQQYKRLATAEIAQTGVRSGTRVIAGFAVGSSVGGLLWSYVIALAVKQWVVRTSASKVAPAGRWWPDATELKSLPTIARSYGDFPRYNMVTGFMMAMTAQLPVFVLGAAFGAEIVGFFAMADRLMRAPVNITTKTLSKVVQQKFAEIWNAGRPIRGQLTRTVSVLMLLGVVPFIVFWSSGEELFSFVLGGRWSTAGRYIEIMAPYFAVMFVGAPFAAAMSAMRRQRVWFWLELCTAVSRLGIIPLVVFGNVTPETVLRVYVWTTVSTKVIAFAVVYLRVPRVHPGFAES